MGLQPDKAGTAPAFRRDQPCGAPAEARDLMAGENYEPDWNSWLLMTKVTVEAAVALSLNIDPRRLLAWKMRAQRTEIAKFEDRVYWVNQWGLRDPNGYAAAVEGWTPTIFLRDLVEKAIAAHWKLPTQLMTLAGPEAGESANAAREVPEGKEQTAPGQTAARPPGISDTDWAHFSTASAFDPAFDKKRGGISAAARHIARAENRKRDTVRRGLHRALRAQRGAIEQK